MKFDIAKYRLLFFVTLIVLLFDQWTKHLVHTNFRWGESLPIIDNFFWLTYVRNRGAAFGILHSMPAQFREPFFILVPCIALVIIFVLYMKTLKSRPWVRWALALIFSGAIGNLFDRIRFKYVVDFLDFHWMDKYHWPAFNIADICIVVGVGILFVDSFFPPKIEEAQSS